MPRTARRRRSVAAAPPLLAFVTGAAHRRPPAPTRGRRPGRGRGERTILRSEPRRGWGGRLHGFRQPLWGEPLRSWPQRRALTGRSTDCPTRHQLTGPRSLAPKQLQPKAAPPTAIDAPGIVRLLPGLPLKPIGEGVRHHNHGHASNKEDESYCHEETNGNQDRHLPCADGAAGFHVDVDHVMTSDDAGGLLVQQNGEGDLLFPSNVRWVDRDYIPSRYCCGAVCANGCAIYVE